MIRFASLLVVAAFASPSLLAQERVFQPSGDPSLRVVYDVEGRASQARVGAQVPPHAAFAPLFPASWTALGPFGGSIAAVGISPTNPSVALAGLAPASGTGGGLFRSLDGGASWSRVSALDGESVYDITFDPAGIAWIGTLDGPWTSSNDGASWTQKPLGIGVDDQVLALAIEPGNPQHVWAGISDAIGMQVQVLLASSDGGATWIDRTPALTQALGCTGIAFDPAQANKVFACFGGFSGGGEVWASSDGGASWTKRSTGLPGNPLREIVHDGTRLLVCGGQLFSGQDVGVFASSDEGQSWSELSDPSWPSRVIQDIAIDPNNPSIVLVASTGAGVFRSTSGGASGTWSFGIGGTSALSVGALAFAPASSSRILLGSTSSAVWSSPDGGASFAPSSAGIGGLDGYSIASNPLAPSELALAFQGTNDGGVYTSLDGGTTWSAEPVPPTRWSCVQFSPQGTLYAISVGPTTVATEGLYRRSGGVWTPIGPDQGIHFESNLLTLRVSRNDPNLIWAGGADYGLAGFEATIWRTLDGGASWSKSYQSAFNFEFVRDLEGLDATDTLLLAAFSDAHFSQAGGVLRTSDGGLSWSPVTNGLPPYAASASVAASPMNPQRCYVTCDDPSTANALYESLDGGQSWAPTGFNAQAQRVVADPIDPDILYLATGSGAPVRASTDQGASFSAYDNGLLGTLRDLELGGGAGLRLCGAGAGGAWASGIAPELSTFCAGDGQLATDCPCSNLGAPGHGCANSANASGALLALSGSVALDDVLLAASAMLPHANAIYLQGTALLAQGVFFGDGVRCVGGTLKRLALVASVAGASQYPGPGDPTLSARSAALGDPLAPGDVRYYQVYYRDPNPSFCPDPPGNTWNSTSAGRVVW